LKMVKEKGGQGGCEARCSNCLGRHRIKSYPRKSKYFRKWTKPRKEGCAEEKRGGKEERKGEGGD